MTVLGEKQGGPLVRVDNKAKLHRIHPVVHSFLQKICVGTYYMPDTGAGNMSIN